MMTHNFSIMVLFKTNYIPDLSLSSHHITKAGNHYVQIGNRRDNVTEMGGANGDEAITPEGSPTFLTRVLSLIFIWGACSSAVG